MITISKASLQDIDVITPLFDAYRVFYEQDSNEQAAKEYLTARIENEESTIFIARVQEEAAGFTQIYPLFSSVSMQQMHLLNDLYVNPEHRGQGLATLLINEAKHFAMENGSKGLSLETHNSNPAQALYERLCFVKDEEYLHYFWKA